MASRLTPICGGAVDKSVRDSSASTADAASAKSGARAVAAAADLWQRRRRDADRAAGVDNRPLNNWYGMRFSASAGSLQMASDPQRPGPKKPKACARFIR